MTALNPLKYIVKDPEKQAFLSNISWGMLYVAMVSCLDVVSTIGLYRDIGVTPWSPSAGLALAFAFLNGVNFWPYIMLGMLASELLTSKATFPFLSAIFMATGSTVIWLSAGAALHRLVDFDPLLRTIRATLLLMGVAFIAGLADTLLTVSMLWLHAMVSTENLVSAAWRYLVGDVVGVLVVTPLVLLLRSGAPWPRPQLVHALQLLVLAAAMVIIFGSRAATTYQLFYLLFLPILWVALRDGVAGATIALNAAQLGIIIGAQFRFGITPGTGALQMMMIVLTITGLLAGVVVTEREAAARWLRNQQAALGRSMRLRSAGETAAAIAHQINQPLTAISTYASIATDALEAGKSEAAKTTMAKLVAECDRAASVLRSIRDLVKQGAMTREPVLIQRLFNDLSQLHAEDLKSSRIQLKLDIPQNQPPFDCDPVQVEQALENLINNSIEAIAETGNPGSIVLSSYMQGEDMIVEVNDDGPGFAPGLDAIATTPFMTTKANGSGLGLAIARSVAEAHGGSLSVVPRNNGATVRLRLPPRRRSTE